jgi:hypothetical protein
VAMGRPHIEFIQAQALPWEGGVRGSAARSDVEAKILSIDTDTGGATCVIRYPKGWTRTAPEHLATDEEFYVLDGMLAINGVEYGPDTYAHLPAGFVCEHAGAERGAVVLTFFDGPAVAGAGNEAKFDDDRLVTRIAAATGDWGNADVDAMGLTEISATSRLMVLFADPANGEMTYLTGVVPFKPVGPPERHPVVQEFYVLAGTLAGNCGVMQAGAYCWRPPLVKHGPYGSPSGALILLRSIGGPLTTELDDPVPHTYQAEHQPVLPHDLAMHGDKPMAPPSRY